jgi:hypothetical protein
MAETEKLNNKKNNEEKEIGDGDGVRKRGRGGEDIYRMVCVRRSKQCDISHITFVS